MPDDNIPSQKYRDTSILRYFVTSSLLDNFCNNPIMRIICSALANSLYHNCVLIILYVNFLPLESGRRCHVLELVSECRNSSTSSECRNYYLFTHQKTIPLFSYTIILYTQPCVKCNRFIIYTTLCKCN